MPPVHIGARLEAEQHMAYEYEDEEIECEIIEPYGKFSPGSRNWNKEVNLVSWNGRPAKLDIRNWQRDHEKCGKGIAVTREEAEELVKLLNKILKETATGPKAGTKAKNRSKKRPAVPQSLEPFYDELKLLFGAGPDGAFDAGLPLVLRVVAARRDHIKPGP